MTPSQLNSNLITATDDGDLQRVKDLVELGANIHADDDAALRIASRNGYLPIVQYLVGRGADVNAENNEALYPL